MARPLWNPWGESVRRIWPPDSRPSDAPHPVLPCITAGIPFVHGGAVLRAGASLDDVTMMTQSA